MNLIIGLVVGGIAFFALRKETKGASAPGTADEAGAVKVAKEAQAAGVKVASTAPGDVDGISAIMPDGSTITGNTADSGVVETPPENQGAENDTEDMISFLGADDPDPDTGITPTLGGTTVAPEDVQSSNTKNLFTATLTPNALENQLQFAVKSGVPLKF